jgi:hypothetical protein
MKEEEFGDYVQGLFVEYSMKDTVKNLAKECAEVANQNAKGEC